MRVPQYLFEELIENEGELRGGPILPIGILRLALDLKEAREVCREMLQKANVKVKDPKAEKQRK